MDTHTQMLLCVETDHLCQIKAEEVIMSFCNMPQEIVLEILHRLPPKPLVRFTTVCKTWNSVINDQSFISEHLNRNVQRRNGEGFLLLQQSNIYIDD